MKYLRKLFLGAMLTGVTFAFSLPTQAQHINVQFDREVQTEITAQNGIGDAYDSGDQTIEDNATNGVFNHSYDLQDTISHETVHGTVIQTTLITNTDNTLTISGTMASMNTSAGAWDSTATGIGSVDVISTLKCWFQIDQPMNFTLSASMLYAYVGDTNPEEGQQAYLLFGPQDGNPTNAFTYGDAPPLTMYGQTTNAYSGTNSGTLLPGSYYMEVAVVGEAAWNSDPNNTIGTYSYSSSNALTFSFTGTIAVPAAPPTIQALTQLNPGLFQINWTAPQDGNYRVLASSNLVDWTESVPSASYNAGANTTQVNGVISSQGFYRLQYMTQ